jgi:Cu/Ag efflux pump CusA
MRPLRPERLNAMKISISEIFNALEKNNDIKIQIGPYIEKMTKLC